MSAAKKKRRTKSIGDLYGIFHEYAKGKTTDWEEIREEAMRLFAEDFVRRKMREPEADKSDES